MLPQQKKSSYKDQLKLARARSMAPNIFMLLQKLISNDQKLDAAGKSYGSKIKQTASASASATAAMQLAAISKFNQKWAVAISQTL